MALDNLAAADRFVGAFEAIGERLGKNLLSAPAGPRPGLRQLTMTSFPYVIVYRVGRDAVTIFGVYHAARHPSVRRRP